MATARLDRPRDITTLVEMSIGTHRGKWWADPEFGSDLWKLKQSGKVGPELANDVRQEIIRCTKWIVDDGLAKSIACDTEIVGKNRVNYQVTTTRPDGGIELIEGVWDGV